MTTDRDAKRLAAWREDPGSAAILTDIDGTLAPIAPTPDQAEVPQELKELLRRLEESYLLVAGVSGRKTEEALDLVGLEDIVYFGNHGFEILRDGELEVTPEAQPYQEKVQDLERQAREELSPSAPSWRRRASRRASTSGTSRPRLASGASRSSGARASAWG